MDLTATGLATFHTRVESWECDFNGHWNTRFYTRSIQAAAEMAATLDGADNMGAAVITSRHLRFYGELFPGDPVEVRSLAIADGPYAGAVAHLLHSAGKLSVTALDLPGRGNGSLPRMSIDELPFLLPRGLNGPTPLPWEERMEDVRIIEAGIVRPVEVDHGGGLLFEEIVRRCALAAHEQIVRLGYSPQFTEQTGVGRMLAELRATLLGRCPVGSPVQVASRLVSVAEKSFVSAHHVQMRGGAPIALIELCTLAVDMKARRATGVPDFLRSQIQ